MRRAQVTRKGRCQHPTTVIVSFLLITSHSCAIVIICVACNCVESFEICLCSLDVRSAAVATTSLLSPRLQQAELAISCSSNVSLFHSICSLHDVHVLLWLYWVWAVQAPTPAQRAFLMFSCGLWPLTLLIVSCFVF